MSISFFEYLNNFMNGETPEMCEKRLNRLRRLNNERFDLEDKIEVLEGDSRYIDRLEQCKLRLSKVLDKIIELGGVL